MIAVVVHDRQTLHTTGRPLCMTYGPWQMTGRPMYDLEAHDMSNQWKYVILMWFDMELHDKAYNYIIYILVT